MPYLFSYGSLRATDVQRRIFGRVLNGEPDSVPGYAVLNLRVADARGAIATLRPSDRPGAAVAGMTFEITDAELTQADAYEATDSYQRIEVTLASGRRCWVYLARQSIPGAGPGAA